MFRSALLEFQSLRRFGMLWMLAAWLGFATVLALVVWVTMQVCEHLLGWSGL